jgi:hypothetical protein
MNSVLRQLNRWRLRERLIRLAWGLGRWFAIVGTVLLFACLADWIIDRYAGSQTWRDVRKSSWVFAPADLLSIGETPFWWFRVPLTAAQLALAAILAYVFLVRPWSRTPPIDDFAINAEKAFPEFDHRLVTAIQLNRPRADTRGMSRILIGEVTREAGEIASRHNVMSLVDYRRLGWAAAVAAPVLLIWGAFFAAKPALATILLKRQALLDVEIPRSIQLENLTPDVWPTGSEVTVRFRVTGQFEDGKVGVLRLVPENQPEEFHALKYEAPAGDGAAYFSVKLPPMSWDFKFQARLGSGRTRDPGEVRFENPPQLAEKDGLVARQILPTYLGTRPDGTHFVRIDSDAAWKRGDVIDALPKSQVLIEARFNKPVRRARLIPVERAVVGRIMGIRIEVADVRLFGIVIRPNPGERLLRVQRWRGSYESALNPLEPLPEEAGHDRRSASWGFNTTPRTIGYRIELVDDRGFRNPVTIRRNIRMWLDREPVVTFKPESTRNPDPEDFYGGGNHRDLEGELPLSASGVVQVIYHAHSEVGIRAANIRYRVIPRGVQMDLYPEEYRRIHHPRDDPNLIVYDRLPLTRFRGDPVKLNLGPFDADLGLFRYSFRDVPRLDRNRVNVQFYPFPSPDPSNVPAELAAGGRYNFEVSALVKKLPDGSTAKLDVGDTVELYLEVYDKLTVMDGKSLPDRPAGYTQQAKRKIVQSESDTEAAIIAGLEAQRRLRDKLQKIADDQAEVFNPKPKK